MQQGGQYVSCYVGSDYVLLGRVFNDGQSLSDITISELKKAAFASVKPKLDELAAFTYTPKGKPIGTVYMITDPLCPYCHRAENSIISSALKSREDVKAFTGKEGDPGMYTVRSTPEGSVVAIEGKGGFRASTSNVILRENADSKGYHLEKVSPETGKAVRGHTEKGKSATTYNDHDQLKGGTDIDRNTMMNMAMSGQNIAANRIANAPTTARREQEEIMQARALAEGLSTIVSKQGRYITFTNTEAGGSLRVGIPGGKLTEAITGVGVEARANLGVGQKNTEERNYNLFYGMTRRIQETAQAKALRSDGSFDWG